MMGKENTELIERLKFQQAEDALIMCLSMLLLPPFLLAASVTGIGNYPGKASFDTFSHQKSILKKSFLFDFNLQYPAYKDKLKSL